MLYRLLFPVTMNISMARDILHSYQSHCLFALSTLFFPPFEVTMAFVFGLIRGPKRQDLNKGSLYPYCSHLPSYTSSSTRTRLLELHK